jgi:hypothetical protein
MNMDAPQFYSIKNKTLRERYRKTIAFVAQTLPRGSRVFDIGVDNPLAHQLRQHGYLVQNTAGEDLDDRPEAAGGEGADAVTTFEILEHLVNPLGVLRAIRAKRLFATIPLALWFARAYRHPTDLRDRHFHEFEDWQFNWLLEKAGWKIVRTEKWKSPTFQLGFRPLLRTITPRYYAVEAER